jgi:hypothetical protein
MFIRDLKEIIADVVAFLNLGDMGRGPNTLDTVD